MRQAPSGSSLPARHALRQLTRTPPTTLRRHRSDAAQPDPQAPAMSSKLAFLSSLGGHAAGRKPLIQIPENLASSGTAKQQIIPTQLLTDRLPDKRFPWQTGFGAPVPRVPRDPAPQARQEEPALAPVTMKNEFEEEEERDNAKTQKELQKERRQREAIRNRKEKGGEPIELPEVVSARHLSSMLGISALELLKTILRVGHDLKTAEELLPAEVVDLVVEEFGFKPVRSERKDAAAAAADRMERIRIRKSPQSQPGQPGMVRRPPVVCIMGHVDHGKTSLLDALRGSSIAASEAGGITQHIRSFVVSLPSGENITFLDTPGHMAFLEMRDRGAQITDIVVLVIAADDGIREQTIESIRMIQKAGAKMVVAINKIDKSGADVAKIKRELLAHEVVLEENGGNVQCVEISATKRIGLDKLEEAILLQADDMNLTAEAAGGEAVLLESYKDPKYGVVMNALVRNGRLAVGDYFVAGTSWGRIRMLVDSNGKEVEAAGAAVPVKVIGAKTLPEPGEPLLIVDGETVARQVVAQMEAQRANSQEIRDQQAKVLQAQQEAKKAELDRLLGMRAGEEGADPKDQEKRQKEEEDRTRANEREVRLIIKTDVSGSLEAVQKLLSAIPQDEVKLSIVRTGFGTISEADVELAQTMDAAILGFNVPVPSRVKISGERMKVPIATHEIVYDLLNDVRARMEKLLPRRRLVATEGEAEILQLFQIKLPGRKVKATVAGCRVTNGSIARKNKVIVLRKGVEIYDGAIETLRHFKDDVQEVKNGSECGIALQDFTDLQVADIIRSYAVSFEQRSLGEQRQSGPKIYGTTSNGR